MIDVIPFNVWLMVAAAILVVAIFVSGVILLAFWIWERFHYGS